MGVWAGGDEAQCIRACLSSLSPYLAVHKSRLTIPSFLRRGVGRLIS